MMPKEFRLEMSKYFVSLGRKGGRARWSDKSLEEKRKHIDHMLAKKKQKAQEKKEKPAQVG